MCICIKSVIVLCKNKKENKGILILILILILFCVVQTAVIVSLDSRMTGLSRALRVFEDTDLHLVHIESRRHKVIK